MTVLPTELRNKLERTIVEARNVAEEGARTALEALAVHHHEPYGHMSNEKRKLRNHLRARARQLGDEQNRKGELDITHLVCECAYEHWHRMLFARFLAENDLLIEPEMGVSISLEECEELAKEDGKDLWTLASEFAQQMLPQIFRPNDPVLKVFLAREHRIKLENLLNDLEPAIFSASDSLGWVYQFWQSKRKKEVNQSGNKIGADELPAVTQLFTEPYMVSFLLDNSLGAWWAARCEAGMGRSGDGAKGIFERAETEEEIRKACAIPGVPLEYLRFVKQDDGAWAPAAGTFESWPSKLSELKVLDPCCGSGHFLVAAFLMLVPMRMELEALSAREAVDAVLKENLHGLEIDRRCVELAAFSLALAAWTYPDAGGYRKLPELNLACSGLSINVSKAEWKNIAPVLPDKSYVAIALDWLYDEFQNAPVLGSLIDPSRAKVAGLVQWDALIPALKETLDREKDNEVYEAGVVAHGLAKATQLLSGKYHWVITNVPYLARGKQSEILKSFCEKNYTEGKNDLATVFLDRCLELCKSGRGFQPLDNQRQDAAATIGTVSIVLPQNWLFLTTYKKFREKLLKNDRWHLIARLGPQAFQTPMWDFNVQLIILSRENKAAEASSLWKQRQDAAATMMIRGLDVSQSRTAAEKAAGLLATKIKSVEQAKQLENPDARVVLEAAHSNNLLEFFSDSYWGLGSGDYPRFGKCFWEIIMPQKDWIYQLSTVLQSKLYGAREHVLYWQEGKGDLVANPGAFVRGTQIWGKRGIHVSQMRDLAVTLYTGECWDTNSSPIIPKDSAHLLAIWCFCSSPEYNEAVRRIDQKLNVTNATLVKVPFDLAHWTKVAEEKYPNGLPKPYSNDPTQWIFHGHPARVAEASSLWNQRQDAAATISSATFQVAVARLLGYRWPAELDAEMELADEQREWVSKCNDLLKYADEDGIVCIPSVRGEEPAADRLLSLLAAAYEGGRGFQPLDKQRQDAAATLPTVAYLDEWLRDHFFEQHCKLFHNRPFIWHIWDGRRRDGFHALVNYHKLAEENGKGRQLLENLTYSYLGEWITRQREGVKRGEGGAEDRLAAALELQTRLVAIIEGEPPFDIFVRWKPIEEQPIGWEPDINDGVRLNIRPFMAQDISGGRKGAGILRWKPNITWGKDRGKDVASAPWFPLFKGDRINDHHLSLKEKRAARAEARGRKGETENG